MKLSLNFVKDYIDLDTDLTAKKIAEDMTNTSCEYTEAGKLIDVNNLKIGLVEKCEKHPDSDHLHICKVNIGCEVLDIVCGAPNVREGLKVIVALPGAKLPGGTIKKGVIRGQESNGMLCSMLELGIDNKFVDEIDKIGIHEFSFDAPIGEDPIKYMNLDDEVIDFELTANRGDLLSVLGMAYELGAVYDKKVKDIDISFSENNDDINNELKLNINTENCSMFLVKKAKNVVIKQSPDFIKARLIASGIRPINNVVDISNYVMLETGQPLHFYDADKINNIIEVRMASNGEKLVTLDNIERILHQDNIVISDGNKSIGLAGVMGGIDTEVTEATKNILIESAIFDSVKVRKTSNEIIRSEASNRFEKGLDPNRTYMAIKRACNLLEKYADSEIVGGIIEYNNLSLEDKKIEIKFSEINKILGLNISNEQIIDIFKKLDFKCEVNDENATVIVPTRRMDINIKEDLIEEVSRLYGVNNIEGILPTLPIKVGNYNKVLRSLRNKMVDLGLNETLTYALVKEDEARNFTNNDKAIIKMLDPISEDRSVLRQSMLISLLKTFEYNKARNNEDISIFEIGKIFYKKEEEYFEELHLGALITGEYQIGIDSKSNANFYIVKGIAEDVLDYLGYENRYSFIQNDEISSEFHPKQFAYISVNNDIIGVIGKLHPSIIENDVFALEINLDRLLEKRVGKIKFKEISKYPSVNKDISVIIDKNISSEKVCMQIKKSAGSCLNSVKIFDVYTGKGIDEDKKSIAFSLNFSKMNSTFTDNEINDIMEKIIKDLENKLNAKLRS